jgi:hypothetical protein
MDVPPTPEENLGSTDAMQPHEGPRPDPEKERQRRLTTTLIGIIGALAGALIVALLRRYG